MGRRFLLTVAVALGTCTVTACGGGSASGPSSSSSLSAPAATPSPSASTDATTAAYRHLLEQANGLFNSDVGSYAFNYSLKNLADCNLGQAPFKDSCRQWVLMDEALANQIVGLLSNAQVPAAAASNDQLLRQGLQMVIADDTAAANALGSGDDQAVTLALGKLQTDSCIAVSHVLSKLDPSIHSAC